ncbi:glycosyltransferase family 25 protein [Rhodovulum sp. 12E13]|uniref:glycosyltransferase family 25 protein n=1 Tax=Rhodovulum sp. 12E13 TaxID=2203891 RepID=UPI001314D7FD|nr:glycosyltransferase family 25 protein [Rhodovulum sp. 12E13]
MDDPARHLAVRVVSLPHSRDRRQAIAENLADLALPWSFFDALGPDDDIGIACRVAEQVDHFGRPLTPGEIGCFKSHYAVWRTFEADPSLDWLLVLEDDVCLDTSFDFPALVAALEQEGLGYLRLFCREWRRGWPVRSLGDRQILFLASDPYGTQGYLVSRRAAARLVASIESIRRPIDDELGRFWEKGLGNCVLFPFPLLERQAPSTLSGQRDVERAAARGKTPRRILNKIRDFTAKRVYLASLALGLRRLARDQT